MANPYINKVVLGNETLLDLTADTVTPQTLYLGTTAHDASGAAIVGTSTAGTMIIRDTQDSHGGTVREITAGSVVTGTKSITANGTYDVAEYADAQVNVPSAEPSLQAKTRTISAAGTFVDTPDSGYDGLSSVTTTVPSASFYVGMDGNGGFFTDGSARRWHIRGMADLDVSEGDTEGWHGQGRQFSNYAEFAAVPANTTITPTTSAQTIGGANYMMEGAVTVAAMPTGTAGTPTATKGTVSNHSVSVRPSVTNVTGYITGGTKTGTAVTVSASELVSGTLSITSSGTKNVTNYASASVAAGGATASATKGSVSNHSITVTPSVTRTAGYVTAGTSSGTAVSVSASELVSGTLEVTESGTYDVTNYASADVNVSGGPTHTITLTNSGHSIRGYVQLNGEGTTYYTSGQTIEFHSGDFLRVHSGVSTGRLYVDDELIAQNTTSALEYNYQLPDGDVSIKFTSNVDGVCYITLANIMITADGDYDVSQYLKAKVAVAGYTVTITSNGDSASVHPSITVNGTGDSHYLNGETFKFNDGDTLDILLQGLRGGGALYLNGEVVYSSLQDATRYNWTPPSCDLSVNMNVSSVSYVYVTTNVMNITANGSYEIPGYGYVNVTV